MRKRAESPTNCQLSFLYHLSCFQNRNLGYKFQTLLAQKWGLAHTFFLYENDSLQYRLRQMAMFLALEVRLFSL